MVKIDPVKKFRVTMTLAVLTFYNILRTLRGDSTSKKSEDAQEIVKTLDYLVHGTGESFKPTFPMMQQPYCPLSCIKMYK